MTLAQYIAIAGVAATLLGVVLTWLVARRQLTAKRLAYSFEIEPLLNGSDPDLARELKVLFRGEELPHPALLSLKISNTGNTAVEKAKVIVQLPDATYLIPGYFIDVPAGYEPLWDIDRTDAEECTIRFAHINPGQVANVRLLMDEMPSGAPRVSCPMPNVRCVRGRAVSLGVFAEAVVRIAAPQLLRLYP
jgi:hypothetical protein